MRRNWIWLTLGAVLLAAIAIGLLLLPRQVIFSPDSGSVRVPPLSPLRLEFSQNMERESVLERLQIEPQHPGLLSWQDKSLIFTPSEPWPAGITVRVTLAAGARSSLGLPLLNDRSWSFVVSRPQLVYLWPLQGPANLYWLDPFTGDNGQLTDIEAGLFDFDVLESSGDVIYSVRRNDGSSIWRWQRLGNTHQLLLECPQAVCDALQTSSDERWLAYVRSMPDAQLWLFHLDGAEARRIGPQEHQIALPGWSPQGWLSYYNSTEQAFYFTDLNNEVELRLPNETGEPLSWAPDGSNFVTSEIIVWEAEQVEYASHLVSYTFPGLQRTDLSVRTNLEDASPVYSPDGRWLAFNRKFLEPSAWTPGRQLWLMHPDGSADRQLTNEPAYGFSNFAWSPDSNWLAYLRFNWASLDEPAEIWLTAVNGNENFRLWIGAYAPQWLP